jgi:tetratricopeptide (TPR) repeat protein
VPAAVALVVLLGWPPVALADDPPVVSWATAQAGERTRLGHDHAARGEQDAALRSFLDAISFDATYGPAYLALGEIYESRGDFREAERTFSTGIDHVTAFVEALVARGKLRARLQRGADAIADFETASALRPESAGILRDLSTAYISAHALPAALAVARRRLALADAEGDAHAATEARVEIRALTSLVGEVDPVTAGATGRGVVRRAIAVMEKRRR